MIFYEFARAVLKVVLHLVFHIEIEGLENLPKDRGYLICANHTSYLDPPLIGFHMTGKVYFMAKESLFRHRAFAWLIRKLGAFPVKHGNAGEENPAVQYAINAVENGEVVALFPEGTRSKTGKPIRAKSGMVLIAHQTGADIVPVGINISRPKRFRSRIVVRYGEVIRNEELGITGGSPHELRKASKLVMDKIIALLDLPKDEETK